jgi:ABC-type sugar transport system ATPase subunit
VTTRIIRDVDMEQLIELMTGKKLETTSRRTAVVYRNSDENALITVRGLTWGHRLRDVHFHVDYGEVVGVTGLMGSGKSEIARAIFGIELPDGGEILIDGETVQIKAPPDAIASGMALVPEDRRYEGLVLIHSVEDNIGLSLVGDLTRGGWFNRKAARNKVEEQVRRLDIKTPNLRQKTEYLSGGNQQKVVVGKWLTRKPKLLILDEPTVGIDVNTKAELRDGIRSMVKDKSCGVLLFSSDLNEIIQVSDRIIVLYRGEVIKELSNEVPVKEELLHRTIQGIVSQ